MDAGLPSTAAAWFWFALVVVAAPLVLWALRRRPLGSVLGAPVMRSVAVLALSPSQRLVTVEVGSGDERRWLVLGVTPGSIQTLHSMAPQAEPTPVNLQATLQASFAGLLARARQP